MINVTKTVLPSIEDYVERIKPLWQTGWLTNRGGMVMELESLLKETLDVPHLLYVNNGMIALQIAIKALQLKGEIITTPYSYVATTGAIIWEGCKPVFVDIEKDTFCIDANLIEEKITENTCAILATHVYGYPCDVKKIDEIAKKYNLKVIYDGAHAFMSMLDGKSLLHYGDMSICSFHATKLFHTIEGGAIICHDEGLAETVRLFHQFGHSYDDYKTIGINGKVSEFHAAMGLCILPHMSEIIDRRKTLFNYYTTALAGERASIPKYKRMEDYNFSYFPVIFESESIVLRIKAALEKQKIYSRRYFYPSLNTLPYVEYQPCPISEDISSRVLCLPFYPDLQANDAEKIMHIVKETLLDP